MNEQVTGPEGAAYKAYQTLQDFIAGPDNHGLLGFVSFVWFRDKDNPELMRGWRTHGGAVNHFDAATEMLKFGYAQQQEIANNMEQRLQKLEGALATDEINHAVAVLARP